MKLINLTTLFTSPVNNAASISQTGLIGSGFQAFRGEYGRVGDNFTSNPLNSTFKSKAEIEQLAKSSPRIMALLKEYNIPLRINMEALEDMR